MEKTKTINTAISEIEKKYGKGSIMKLDETRKVNVDVIPTGSLALDKALGVWGMPRGRIVEIFGPESSGKTTLCLHLVREEQKRGGKCAFIDTEHALDPEYAKMIGVNTNELYVSQPGSGEEALDITETLLKTKDINLIIIDSVAALTPKAEIEGEMGKLQIGLQARLMSQALRKLTAITAKSNTTIIFVNQIRMNIGVKWGSPETTPGGVALKFYTSVRVEVRHMLRLKNKDDEHIGNKVKFKVAKNKVSAPFKTGSFDLYFNEGISQETDVLNIGEEMGILKKEKNSYFYNEEKIGASYEKARLFLKENEKVRNEIIGKIQNNNCEQK
ncbi:MAG: recombinase RecA [Methanogenium sp.]|jgi:recombination protein RecA